ncbi:MAG TPA: hypothetical protein VFV56_02705 [Gaiellaceae bacterium]|nr:hypothetical protein [Gaiellaceae bacterium]
MTARPRTAAATVGSTAHAAQARFAVVEDIAASWERYERFARQLEEAPPEGLILHAAGRTDEGFRIVEIWESEEAWRSFADLVGDDSPHIVRALRPEHVVYGGREEGK